MGQDKILEAGEDLLTKNNSPSQIPNNLEELDKDEVGSELTGEDMAKLWSNKDVFGRDKRESLVWHHRLKHCSLKPLIIISMRGIISRKISRFRKIPLCVACMFEIHHKRPWRTK